jgi:uncharacterized protein (TIGR03437 family)
MAGMQRLTGWVWAIAAGLLANGSSFAQTLGNKDLSGKYFLRHISLGTDAAGNLTDPRSLIGAITFDGSGHYSFTGQQVQGNNASTSQTGSGAYAVDPAGFVSMDSPLRSGATVNARLGPEALLGSSTESAGNTFDLLVVIPAPAVAATAPVLAGSYRTVTLEFPGASGANARNTIFNLAVVSAGKFADFTANGHAANQAGGTPITQQVTGATYLFNTDGSGTLGFGFGATGASPLLNNSKNLYVSADGNVVIGGSTANGSHDILIGVKSVSGATNSTWNGDFWGAGLRFNPSAAQPDITGYSGAYSARGLSKLTWTKRFKTLSFGTYDFTGINGYALNPDGSGTVELSQIGLGAGGKAAVGSAISMDDPGAYEVFFSVQMAPLSGTGVFVNPQRIISAAGFAPAGSPISPGEFIAVIGTGLAKSNQAAPPPYPSTLNGVTVLINNKPAPLYFVSATQINCLVPYATTGATATVVVQNGTASSNSVTVPVAATMPGIFSLDQSGSGPGAILHADYSLVNADKPAISGETVLIFLTGMGAVSPSVPDGTAGAANPLSKTTVSSISVLIGGEPAAVIYSGLAPGFPGLYQMNVTLPAVIPFPGTLPVAIVTPNAVHDQVDIVVQ